MNKLLLAVSALIMSASSAYSLEISGADVAQKISTETAAANIQTAPQSLDKLLNLTDEQRAKRKELRDKNREEINELRKKMQDLRKSGMQSKENREKNRELAEKMRELRKKEMQDFEAILTPEQKAKLENIKNQKR